MVGTVALVVTWILWYVRTPDGLPTTPRAADGAAVVGQELSVGMFAVGDDFDRTLAVSGVSVDVESDADVEVTPKICRGGTVSVTTDAERFCPELEDVEGADFSDGDSIVLVVSASEPTDVEIGRIEISFREGLQWGTKEAGLEGATLSFADHDPGTVEESPETDESSGDRPGDDEDDEQRDKDRQTDRKKDNEEEQQQSQGA